MTLLSGAVLGYQAMRDRQQRLALGGVEAGQHDEVGDGHRRRPPGNLEAVMGGEGAERRDVLAGDMLFGGIVRPLAGEVLRSRTVGRVAGPDSRDAVLVGRRTCCPRDL